MGHSRQEPRPADLRDAGRRQCATISSSTPIPIRASSRAAKASSRRSARSSSSGHDAIKFDPFPHYEGHAGHLHGYLDGELSKKGEREAAELTALIRETAGPEVEILIDAHGRFDVPTAIRLCRALEDAGQIDWFEEPVPVESYNALRQVRERVSAAISVGERLHTRWEFVPIFENRLADYVMPDVTWAGGITELKKIAIMAEAYYVPITPHDASGPINVVAGAHVMMTVPNFYRIETSSYDLSHYNKLIEEPLDNRGGRIRLNGKPGLGVAMNLDYLQAQRDRRIRRPECARLIPRPFETRRPR